LDANLEAKGGEPRCAIHVINLDTGATEHWVRIDGVVRELYDVVALPGVVRPQMLGFKTDEIRRTLRLEAEGQG